MDQNRWTLDWHDSLSAGIADIDKDHKNFIRLLDDFNWAVVNRIGLDEVKNCLQLLVDDAEQHFAREEGMLRQRSYPDVENHVAEHKAVLAALQKIKAAAISYDLSVEWIELGLKIKGILINHILMEDMKFANFFKSPGE